MIAETVTRYGVSIMQATPATWQLLIEAGWKGAPALKALCGGDALTRKLADQLLHRVKALWNMYGPTETTVWSSVNQINKGNDPITIGHPIGNTTLYVLDNDLQIVPIGVVGELHIGGEGVANGYLGRDDLISRQFIPDPFGSKPGARLYKTGDRARYLENDSIEILGRLDDQVKINGHRIELKEIGEILSEHPSVHDAIVIAMETPGEKKLVAYFVQKSKSLIDITELREFLGKKLPPYMIPAFFINVDLLPLTANGKIDRKALPLPMDMPRDSQYVAPRNEQEKMMTEIWQNVLRIDCVGIHDNFFDLGGASMQSLQVVAKANMYGIPLSVENIFEYQTIAELAAQIRDE
jgi:acyl-coenzyme A synthetase/AMP-(fatty) acid ligase